MSKLCREHLEIRAQVEDQPGIVAVKLNGKLLLIVQCVGKYVLAVIACSKPKMIFSRVVMREQTALAITIFLLNRGRSVKLIHDFESEAGLGRFEELDTADNAVSPSWSIVFVLGAGVEIWASWLCSSCRVGTPARASPGPREGGGIQSVGILPMFFGLLEPDMSAKDIGRGCAKTR